MNYTRFGPDFKRHFLMANDVNRRSQQSFIIAYPQNSSKFEIAIGYFERVRSLEVQEIPKVRLTCKKYV